MTLSLASERDGSKVREPPRIFDRRLLLRRRLRALRSEPVRFLLEQAADDLVERLSVVNRAFALAVDVGTPGDTLRSRMQTRQLAGQVIGVDAIARAGVDVVADEEGLPFAEGSLDLLVSALALQWVNDLPGTLAQIRRALKPDGLFLAALLGGETLSELRQCFAKAEAEIEGGVSPRVIPFADIRDLGALLQRAGFALPVTDVDRLTVRYATALDLMRDLRGMGATNVLLERRRTPLRRATLLRMAEIYARDHADADGRLRATFDVVWMSGWAPHASQQQPLKPGSARHRLADALKAVRSFGEDQQES